MATRVTLDFSSLIAERTQHFSGRDWVFERINQWLADPNGGRVFLLAGGPGAGKTAIAARLAQVSEGSAKLPPACDRLQGGFLTHMHFCQAGLESTLSPIPFVRALSEALANAFPAFRESARETGVRPGRAESGREHRRRRARRQGDRPYLQRQESRDPDQQRRCAIDVRRGGARAAAGSCAGASRSGRGRADRFPRRGADVQPGAQHRPLDAAGERFPSKRPLHPDGPIQQCARDRARR